MDKAEFEKLTLDQLRKEADKYGLPTGGSKSALIEAIITHLSEHGPIEDLLLTEVVPTGQTVFAEQRGSLARDNELQGSPDVMLQMMAALQRQQD
ncbi:miz zinc finger family protein [Lasius niger]|uniref:Miz zinc finger family protein n=1 Tax=Lasius niger TaxID=67767 RepID=A0A0J7K2R0_LASNI|nr:miz zinc finger family protein [Lasius niger]